MKQIFAVLMLLSSSIAWGQSQMDDLTVDELFKKARTAAFEEEDYDKAREFAYLALEENRDYHDVRIFVARIYAWEERYGKAKKELQKVLAQDHDNYLALTTLIDVESWAANEEDILKVVNKALKHYHDDEKILQKKASVLSEIEEYNRAEKVYKKILDRHPENKEALDGLEAVRLEQMKYTAKLSYRYDHFVELLDPWQFFDFSLSRETPYGPVAAEIQYARRFGSEGVQFGIDTYPSIKKGFYANISGGYSSSFIFPNYRFGIALYKSLPASLELSAGMQYLNYISSQTDFYRVSLTKYLENHMFTVRTYLVPVSGTVSNSLNIMARRYFGSGDAYLGAQANYGSVPTEIQELGNVQIKTLDAWSLSIDGRFPFSERLFVGGVVELKTSNFPSYKRNQYSFRGSVSYRL